MSIKIYNGLRLTNPRANIFAAAKKIREVLEPVFYRKFLSLLPSNVNSLEIFDMWDKVNDLNNSAIRTMEPEDIGYTVSMLDHGLVMVFSEKTMVFSEETSYRSALLVSGIVEEYGYWDNTDRPENVSPQQWGARARLWGSALGDFNLSPAEAGLTFGHPSATTTFLKIGDMRRSAAN